MWHTSTGAFVSESVSIVTFVKTDFFAGDEQLTDIKNSPETLEKNVGC